MKISAPAMARRNGKHDDERVLETFELCRQNKIDKYQCRMKANIRLDELSR